MAVKERNTHKIVLLSFAIALTFLSCSRKTVYSHYLHTHSYEHGWHFSDTLTFVVEPLRKGGLYFGEVGVRTYADYPFTTLPLIIGQQAIPSGISRSDTIIITIADEHGMLTGNGINLHQYTHPTPSLSLLEGDTLTVRIRHAADDDTLTGVADIGFSLIAE